MSVCLPVGISVYLSLCLSVCLSLCLSVCLSVCLSLSINQSNNNSCTPSCIYSDTYSWISMLSSRLVTFSSLVIKVSQAWFISGTIRFIFKALKEGDSVFRMCRHFSPLTTLTKLFSGGGNSSKFWKRKKENVAINVMKKLLVHGAPSIWHFRGEWKTIFVSDSILELISLIHPTNVTYLRHTPLENLLY